MAYKTTNPATGEVTASFDNISDDTLAARLDELDMGFRTDWPIRPIAERSRIVARAAQIIREEMPRLAAVIAGDMGKLLSHAIGELTLSAAILGFRWNIADDRSTYGHIRQPELAAAPMTCR